MTGWAGRCSRYADTLRAAQPALWGPPPVALALVVALVSDSAGVVSATLAAALGVVSAQAVLVFRLVKDRRGRPAAEPSAEAIEAKLRRLLLDGVLHDLAGIGYVLGALERGTPPSTALLEQVGGLLRRDIDALRRLAAPVAGTPVDTAPPPVTAAADRSVTG